MIKLQSSSIELEMLMLTNNVPNCTLHLFAYTHVNLPDCVMLSCNKRNHNVYQLDDIKFAILSLTSY